MMLTWPGGGAASVVVINREPTALQCKARTPNNSQPPTAYRTGRSTSPTYSYSQYGSQEHCFWRYWTR